MRSHINCITFYLFIQLKIILMIDLYSRYKDLISELSISQDVNIVKPYNYFCTYHTQNMLNFYISTRL